MAQVAPSRVKPICLLLMLVEPMVGQGVGCEVQTFGMVLQVVPMQIGLVGGWARLTRSPDESDLLSDSGI